MKTQKVLLIIILIFPFTVFAQGPPPPPPPPPPGLPIDGFTGVLFALGVIYGVHKKYKK